jgi:hypothetical protein
MNATLLACSRACIPTSALPVLAALRLHAKVRVVLIGQQAWLSWPAQNDDVVQCLLTIRGVRFFLEKAGTWYEYGSRLPAFDLPAIEPSLPLEQVLIPDKQVRAAVPNVEFERLPLRLVPDDCIQPTTASLCSLDSLAAWADQAPTFAIEQLRGVWAGGRALVLGNNLPHLPGDRRFWGRRLLLPLGYRLEPCSDEEILLGPGGPLEGELVLFDGATAERMSPETFKQLTRAGIRLAARNGEA